MSGRGPVCIESAIDESIARAQRRLRQLQQEDGHWCAELQGDTILESEYLLLLYYLSGGDERKLDRGRFHRACNYVRSQQLDSGGWATYPGGDPDVSQSVKAYFVLKLAGDLADAEHMQKARRAILEAGGVEATNSYTKLYLAIFGQVEWREAPAVPPELILLPRWFYLNIYAMSSWSRAIVVPLSIVWATRPECSVPGGCGIEELRSGDPAKRLEHGLGPRFWASFFRYADFGVKVANRLGLFRPVRERALQRCERWVAERLRKSDGLGAIFPPIINTVIAFTERGYAAEHPILASQMRELEKLELRDGDELRLQPCFSPVWDTALSLNALLDAGTAPHDDTVQRGVRWLLDHEAREPGDWHVGLEHIEPSGWYFEYANEFYPDCDDTAEVLSLLARVTMTDPEQEERRRAAVGRGLAWQRAMQNRDGGWGAFDRECNRKVLEYVPFADHNAMIDPSTSDITSRSVEAFIAHGDRAESDDVARALGFLLDEQEDDGAWYGRWGVNYLYGTWLSLGALSTAGVTTREPFRRAAQRGAEWLLSCQNEDGGWGETARSYEDPSLRGCGPSTAAQTAWGMIGLLSARAAADSPERLDEAVARAAHFLLEGQGEDGVWDDGYWTGTGFPTVFYLKYHYYDHYFPLQALSSYREHLKRSASDATGARRPS
ncbi:MAG: squalene--hopene cyclase [Acidobacteriota bacterium]